MPDMTFVPDFDEIASQIKQRFDALRVPYRQWADLARLAIQVLPYDVKALAGLETSINTQRAALRKLILVASEHFTEEQLTLLRKHVEMSTSAWKSLKSHRPVTIKHGFYLVIY